MGSSAWRLRAGVLVLVGALVVHELRYVLAGRHQDEHAHVYMPWVLVVACALLALAVAELAARLAIRVHRGAESPPAAGVRWLAVSSLLMGIFAGQEIAEQLLAHGHVDVAASVVSGGAWLAVPLAFATGAVIALLLRGAEALLARLRTRGSRPPRPLAPSRNRLARSRRPRPPVIACHLAGRAPPPVVT
jgi:hypothetical protein